MAAFYIGNHFGNAVLASTMAFGTLCTARLVHGFNCKADMPVVLSKKLWNNKYLLGAFALGLCLITAVLMIPACSGVFQVQTLTGTRLLIVYGLAALNLPIIQIIKMVRVKMKK